MQVMTGERRSSNHAGNTRNRSGPSETEMLVSLRSGKRGTVHCRTAFAGSPIGAPPEVALDKELVLLGVAAGDDQVVLAAHEPVEALEPVRLAHLLNHLGLLLDLQTGSADRHVYHSSCKVLSGLGLGFSTRRILVDFHTLSIGVEVTGRYN